MLFKLLRWFVVLWHKRQRRIDLKILWPICKEKASDIDHARAAFAAHAFHDPAYSDLTVDEIAVYVDKLS